MSVLNDTDVSDSLVLFSSDDENTEAHYETKQYDNLSSLLKGVPPPSSITISKLSANEMLEKYQQNETTCGFWFQSDTTNEVSVKRNPVPFLKYMNSSQLSEKIASLMQKVQERYVQLETMSSCNIWFQETLQTCGSAKKRMRSRQAMGISPGRRLSHLARRRQFFSSANLKNLVNSQNVRQIEIRKNDYVREERKKMNRTIEYDKLNSSKRALFLSPDNGTPTKYGPTVSLPKKIYSSGSEERKKLPLQENSKVLKWLNHHNFDSELPRKRLREECASHTNDRKRRCPRRSLNFSDEEVIKPETSAANSNSEKKTSSTSGKLSESHKHKLLWAVSVVLKENNITRTDDNFKTCAANLFHLCRKNLDEILSQEGATGTSDKILIYARKRIPEVFKELGIAPKKTDQVQESSESKENENQNSNRKDFVFKTPMKVCRKRVVKSCQKASPNVLKKRKTIRRWHSLESLVELTNLDKGSFNLKETQNPVAFSPVASSVKDDDAQVELYPALTRPAENGDSVTSSSDDGQIGDQDKELEIGMREHGFTEDVGEEKTEEIVAEDCQPQIEKATYKPRKLIVKKSKLNWKVVRKDSEESESDELRLKMRLSHEWEVVARNSSCSEVGNNSECEVNSSRVSSVNDEKDFSSEVEEPQQESTDIDEHSVNGPKMDAEVDQTNTEDGEDEIRDFENCENILSSTLNVEEKNTETESCLVNESEANTEQTNECDDTSVGQETSAAPDTAEVAEECPVDESINDATEENDDTNTATQTTEDDEDDTNTANTSNITESDREAVPSPILYHNRSGDEDSAKKKLTLEGYKARKLRETKSVEEQKPKKKIYNIRLKHPIRKKKHKRTRTHSDTEKSQSDASHHTIAENLSRLSDLVDAEMKYENGKSESDAKKMEWLSDVSSWCRANMTNFLSQLNNTTGESSSAVAANVNDRPEVPVQGSCGVDTQLGGYYQYPNFYQNQVQYYGYADKPGIYDPNQFTYPNWQYQTAVPFTYPQIYPVDHYVIPNYVQSVPYYYNG